MSAGRGATASTVDLDDPEAVAGADPGGMLAAVEHAAVQWREGITRADAAATSPGPPDADGVVVCGMGGSGIAGDVLRAVAASRCRVPVSVVKGYTLPAHVGPSTLVLAVSYSGNTEETLACYDEAVAREARVVAVATGGRLADRAAHDGIPVVPPLEGLQPRAALPSLAAIALALVDREGLLPGIREDLDETEGLLVERARAWGRDAAAGTNEAKRLARALHGLMPHVWGQEGELAVAALRWRCQLNENAKIPAFERALPELDHNELAGYEPGLPQLAQMALVALRSPEEDPRVGRRVDATLAVAGDRYAVAEQVWIEGQSPLARLMTAALLGDFVSVYLALLRGVDPTPVDAIERLKRRLAGP